MAQVTFVKTDSTTQGSWRGVYGSDGFSIPNDSQFIPSYAAVVLQNQATFTWAASTTDARALQNAENTGRLASCWYTYSNFSFDVNFTDGNTHRLAMYFLDWDNIQRVESVQIVDAGTQAILYNQTLSGFSSGVYLVWKISGHVVITITYGGSGNNAAVSGFFFGDNMQTASQTFGLSVQAPLAITTTSPLPAAVEGQAYSEQLQASGGSGTYTWSLVSGSSLPAGLTLSAAGLISGTPTVSGSFTFTVQVQG